ncbi:MAG: 16S rRNA (adenine(1518)-N(6)/adenine(1519)-N(6))-dimethyltransferase RsmA [Candidatus Gracilibacteria bacterium]|nr:16S rRNA (adenine(1518)-N(6)/adenine(1519)-N(6))-dimethyltransferase RsmA [Candidatus Gracilibacteria bacterium]
MKNLANIDELQDHLRKYGISADKSLGQHFLVNEQVLSSIVDGAELTKEDTVLEVGPGPGVLSQRLVKEAGELIAVEIDEKMIKPWKGLMSDYVQASIIHQDVLKYIPPQKPYKVVANIPYYISSPILQHFLRNPEVTRPTSVILLIQKEVAERVCSTKKPTLLSWLVQIYGAPSIVCNVPPNSFFPPPKVDSAVLKIDVLDNPLVAAEDMDKFFELLEYSYKQPRKTLSNNLKNAPKYKDIDTTELLEKAGVDGGLRPHQLGLEEWNQILETLS